MWQYLYLRATEIAAEREHEASLSRLAHIAREGRAPRLSAGGRVLRWGGSVARHLVGPRPGPRTLQPDVRAASRAVGAASSPSSSPAAHA